MTKQHERVPPVQPRKRRRWPGEAPRLGHCDDSWNEQVRGESRLHRADRNFVDILQETRVLQTGVQILFALIVTAAFTGRLASDLFTRTVYVGTLVAVVTAAALLIAPVAYHRAFFRTGRKRELVERSHQLVMFGVASLLVALSGSMLLVLEVVLARPLAIVLAGVIATGLLIVWFILPAGVARRR